ncbi:uroporphyrinogen-III C-methyltransferase [Candidatus Photodesmus blepharus]|uniref:uroporphyrinogen-III C-methyltransferase n=1 Tax=Candidatus Photodesmus blepharonis TaxID=1179155 RepID=UPI00155A3CD8|nr:uroporphyrinogen-III C-methyltransferase [Candidatus Photodesmus blepharus]
MKYKVVLVTIVTFLILTTGAFIFQIYRKSAQYEAQISELSAQLDLIQENMGLIERSVLHKTTEITNRVETVFSQQRKNIENVRLLLDDVKILRPKDWLLAEVHYLVRLTEKKLFFEHDVISAIRLMESADQRIAALDDLGLVFLREAISDDILKLKQVSPIDRHSLVLSLINLQKKVDNLPLINYTLLSDALESKETALQDTKGWQSHLKTSLKDFLKIFFTFKTYSGDSIPLLSRQTHIYVKENIKSKIETAINSVYAQQNEIYITSLNVVAKWSLISFEQQDSAVMEFNKLLDELTEQSLLFEYPEKLQTSNIISDVVADRFYTPISVKDNQ